LQARSRRRAASSAASTPICLDLAHKKLDAVVFAAYGWEDNPSDEEIPLRLLELNRERATAGIQARHPTHASRDTHIIEHPWSGCVWAEKNTTRGTEYGVPLV
jgi:hypothetical protein